jgi:UDP-N-acetylglucosamine 1-carboxyvinyltransferase
VRLLIKGGAPLKGLYPASGNSNEAIVLMAASLLTAQPCHLHNVPPTQAVQWMGELAEELGSSITRDGDHLTLNTALLAPRPIKNDFASRPVASLLLLAPLLAQRGHAALEWPDSLGRLHTHLTALRDLGVKVDQQGHTLSFSAQAWKQQSIVLAETSVTATALICMIAAVLGEETTLYNAASEPHLRALQHFLVSMGARIEGIGSNLLTIHGQPDGLAGATQTLQPSYIEIASIAAMSAITEGHVTIEGVPRHDLRIIQKVYERLGLNLIFEESRLHVPEEQSLVISRRDEDVDVAIDSAPWPGFPSDLIPMATVLATQANGTTLIHEKLFNNRLLFVDKLKAMGAQIVLADPHRAVVIGPTPLHAEYVDTPDVRIGLALLAAALCAQGQTTIDRAEVIGRNFEGVIPKLMALGAQITIQEAATS